MKKIQKRDIQKDIFICIAIGTLLFFIFRLWIICFLLIVTMLIIVIVRVFRKTESQEDEFDMQRRGSENIDLWNGTKSVYEKILKDITQLIRNDYPEANWVWAQPNARYRIENSEEVIILLNRSGGYRRAKVKVSENQVLDIEYITSASEPILNADTDSFDKGKTFEEAQMENYELLAFEWVEAHIMELNERCNEAIGQGITNLLLTAGELPMRESWLNICEELKCAGLYDVVCLPDGIKIKIQE